MHNGRAGGGNSRRRAVPRSTTSSADCSADTVAAAVDAIVGHLRRLLLLQAWQRWRPPLSKGDLADGMLERQRARLGRSASLDSVCDRRLRYVPEEEQDLAASDRGCSVSSPLKVSFCEHLEVRDGLEAKGLRESMGRGRERVKSGRQGKARSHSSPAQAYGGGRTARRNSHPVTRDGSKTAQRRGGGGKLTVEACFTAERMSFIRDLQVLHRQLEAKDRNIAKREREHRAASARIKGEVRVLQERVDALREEAQQATQAKAAAEARADLLTQGLDRQTAEAETLRTRLRHTDRLHKDQMDLGRRQQQSSAEEASGERRLLENSALAARRALMEGRRVWAAEKDVMLAAVREASHRAELAEAGATEAKGHAVLLEERLQQTLEREAILSAEAESQRISAREAERRAARAESDSARAKAAAEAQEEAFLEHVKGLEERASRAEIMQGREQISREELQEQFDTAKEASLAAASEAQSELSAANLRAASLTQEVSTLRTEADALGRRVTAAEKTAGSVDPSLNESGLRLSGACSDNASPKAAAAQERMLLQEQWRSREKRWRLGLSAAVGQRQDEGHSIEGRLEDDGLPDILAEVEALHGTVMRLSRDKELLLQQLSGQRESECRGTAAAAGVWAEELVERPQESPLAWGGARGAGGGEDAGPHATHVQESTRLRSEGGHPCQAGADGVQGREKQLDGQPWRAFHRDSCADGRRTPSKRAGHDGAADCSSNSSSSNSRSDDDTEEGATREDVGLDGDHGNDSLRGRCSRAYEACGHAGSGAYNSGEQRRRRRRRRQPWSDRALSATNGRSTAGAEHERVVPFDVERDTGVANAPAPETGHAGRRVGPDRNDAVIGGEHGLPVSEDDEALLVPRGGPAPVPSPLTSRATREKPSPATLPSRSVATAALLRTSLEQERRRRQWEHDTLLAVLLEEGIALSARANCHATDAESVPTNQEVRYKGLPTEDSTAGKNDGSARAGDDSEGVDPSEGRVEEPGDGLPTPLAPESWRSLLEALQGTLQRGRGGRAVVDNAVSLETLDPSRATIHPLGTTAHRSDTRCDGRDVVAASDENVASDTSDKGRRLRRGHQTSTRNTNGKSSDLSTKAEEIAAVGNDSDESRVSQGPEASPSATVPGALAFALRELLSSTLGVPEEGVREAPLTKLVGALRQEWEALLQGLAAMQEEVDRARHRADVAAARIAEMSGAAAPTLPKAVDSLKAADGSGSPSARDPSAARVAFERRLGSPSSPSSAALLSAGDGCACSWDCLAAGKEVAQLKATVAEAERVAKAARTAANLASEEAENKLSESERARSETTTRLSEALRELAAVRSEGNARADALEAELRAALASSAAAQASVTAAAATRDEVAGVRSALEDREREAERLRAAAEAARSSANTMEERLRELEAALREARVDSARGVKEAREEGRREGRRDAELRVNALETALEKLAETGSAAEGLAKEHLEVTRELSFERDDLLEENKRSAARLDELTAALRELREEKAQLGAQLLDREREIEVSRADTEVERAKVARLHMEVEKAQDTCRDMQQALLELQATQEQLRVTRQRFATASRELEILRRRKDQVGPARDEARRLRECLEKGKSANADLSARAEAVEARAERESQRARQLQIKVDILQHQLDQVPDDLLVAHAEKRVLRGALDEAAQKAADVKASAAAEIRRRDADIRNFAAEAALQQERCGQRLREQALTIHQLTLQGFSVEARAEAQAASAAGVHAYPSGQLAIKAAPNSLRGGMPRARFEHSANAGSTSARPAPRRSVLEEGDPFIPRGDRRRRARACMPSSLESTDDTPGFVVGMSPPPPVPRDCRTDTTKRHYDRSGGDHRRTAGRAGLSGGGSDFGGERKAANSLWGGQSLDSEFPVRRLEAVSRRVDGWSSDTCGLEQRGASPPASLSGRPSEAPARGEVLLSGALASCGDRQRRSFCRRDSSSDDHTSAGAEVPGAQRRKHASRAPSI